MLECFENWHCQLQSWESGSLLWVHRGSFKWPPLLTESGEYEAENIIPSFLFLAIDCRKELEVTSNWQVRSSSETHSCFFAERGCLVLTFKWTYQRSLWVTEFLYLMSHNKQFRGIQSPGFFYIATVEWKQPTTKISLWKREVHYWHLWSWVEWVHSPWIKLHSRWKEAKTALEIALWGSRPIVVLLQICLPASGPVLSDTSGSWLGRNHWENSCGPKTA